MSQEKAENSGKKNNAVGLNYRQLVRRQFGKNRMAVWSLRFLWVLIFVAVFGSFLVNERPLYCKIDGETYFPVFKQIAVDLGLDKWESKFVTNDWDDHEYESVVRPLVPYSYNTQDLKNSFVGPFDEQRVESLRWRHWLGTDNLGRDVVAGLVHGTRIALLTGIIAMSIASLIGIFFGAVAGYFGDDKLKVSWLRILLNVVGLVLAIFYGFLSRGYAISEGKLGWELIKGVFIFSAIMWVFNFVAKLLERFVSIKKGIRFPADLLIMRLIEIMNSIPALLLLLSVVALFQKPSIFNVMVIIGLIGWTGIARFVRAELMRIRNLEYIQATRALGFKEKYIILRHALPNALGPVLISVAFGIANAVLIEAFLSFLGIGLPADMVTWGTMLNEARNAFDAWWIALFPGLAIFVTVTLFNLIGEGLTDAMDTR
ncbi:MAG: ABC transporter permease [Bacteroidetes bacterium]|nr:MAG: ABC transporter permease [Bacteroidota bacterium]